MARSSSSWKPGQSGNPAGRRRDSAVVRARALLSRNLPAVVQVLINQALAGDVQAARTLVDRLIPTLRPVDGDEMAAIEARLAALEAQRQ